MPEARSLTAEEKRHRKTLSLSAVLGVIGGVATTCMVAVPTAWFIAGPAFVGFLGDALADEITELVQKQVAPVNAGLKVLIESTIAQLEDDISRLEFRRDYMPESWQAADVAELTNKTRRLSSQRRALAAIVEAERS